MTPEEGLLDIVLQRAERSGLTGAEQLIVLGAFEGEGPLQEALAGEAEPRSAETPAGAVSAEREHAYLQAVSVCGFRGIGAEATLRLQPGPGLTLVVGRNGSGKSSLAEAVEVVLTGTTYRWKDKTKDWKSGWRNLHHGAEAAVSVELLVDGDVGQTKVSRSWADDDVDRSDCWVQRPGRARAPLSTLGWDADIATYRPFLSYSELGQVIAGKPSEMYDALASILGLEQVTEAEYRLNEARKRLDGEVKEVKDELGVVRSALEKLDDDRARRALSLLAARQPRLDEVADLVAAAGHAGEPAEVVRLRRLGRLEWPDQERVSEIAATLRRAASALEAVRGTQAEQSRLLAELLRRALDHHRQYQDQTNCPVCGTADVLDRQWVRHTEAEMGRLRQEAEAADAARKAGRQAVAEAHALLLDPPSWLPQESPLRVAWQRWAAGRSVDDMTALADYIDEAYLKLDDVATQARSAASSRLTEIEDRWQPVAMKLGHWIQRAQAVDKRQELRRSVKRSYDWLRDVGLSLRNDRLRPLAEQSAEIWEMLRQDSNVALGPVSLAGKATSRRVTLDVTVDGVDGGALGVMSQGELHALALALFLPRATVPESPFGFLVIDDPVQSMDPAKVDGLASVLSKTAADRQVVVFTHDSRLPDAIRRLDLPSTIWEVVRRENSEIELRKAHDPARRALEDARMLLRTTELPSGVAPRVVPGLCRSALEAAFVELARRRRLAAGVRHLDVENDITAAQKLQELAALALLGDIAKGGEVFNRLNRYGGWAVDAYKACRTGGHAAYTGNLDLLVKDTSRLVERIRAER